MMLSNNECITLFKSLGVPTRMEIYKYLQDSGESTVGEIVEKIGLTQPTISYHLCEMKEENILKSDKKGKEVFYSINTVCPHNDGECVFKNISFKEIMHADH